MNRNSYGDISIEEYQRIMGKAVTPRRPNRGRRVLAIGILGVLCLAGCDRIYRLIWSGRFGMDPITVEQALETIQTEPDANKRRTAFAVINMKYAEAMDTLKRAVLREQGAFAEDLGLQIGQRAAFSMQLLSDLAKMESQIGQDAKARLQQISEQTRNN